MMAGKILLTIIVIFFSILCSVQDIRDRRISNILLLAAIISVFVLRLIFDLQNLWTYILCGMLSGLFYFIVQRLSGRRLGNADIIFGIFQGLVLIPEWLFICLMAECLSAGIFFLIRRLIFKNRNTLRLPFIPFMSAGLLISHFIFFIS